MWCFTPHWEVLIKNRGVQTGREICLPYMISTQNMYYSLQEVPEFPAGHCINNLSNFTLTVNGVAQVDDMVLYMYWMTEFNLSFMIFPAHSSTQTTPIWSGMLSVIQTFNLLSICMFVWVKFTSRQHSTSYRYMRCSRSMRAQWWGTITIVGLSQLVVYIQGKQWNK